MRISFFAAPRAPARPLYGSDFLAALRLAEYAALIILAAVMVIGRPGLMTWTFFAYAITSAPFTLDIGNYLPILGDATLAIEVFKDLTNFSAAGLMMMFCVMVPLDNPPPGWRTAGFWFGAAIGAAGFLLGLVQAPLTDRAVLVDQNNVFGSVTSAILVGLLVARVVTTQARERARFGWAALGIGLLIVIDAVRSSHFPPTVRIGASMITVLPPAVLAYAVLKRHVVDVSFAISRTVVYAVITTILVAVIGGVDWATTAYLNEARVALALDAAVTIAIAIVLNRVHKWIERSVEALLFRDKYEAQQYLRRIGHSLIEADSEQTVDRVIVHDPFNRLHLASSALFRSAGGRYVLCASADPHTTLPPMLENDHDLVRLLRVERSHINLSELRWHHSGMAIPIFQGRHLSAFVVYGAHRDGTAIDPDEVDTLDRLCESAAQAYTLIENARYRAAALATP